jgi:hypothetical protein
MKPDILSRVDQYLAKGWPDIYADTLLRELIAEHRRLKVIFRAKRRAKTVTDKLFDTGETKDAENG